MEMDATENYVNQITSISKREIFHLLITDLYNSINCVCVYVCLEYRNKKVNKTVSGQNRTRERE